MKNEESRIRERKLNFWEADTKLLLTARPHFIEGGAYSYSVYN